MKFSMIGQGRPHGKVSLLLQFYTTFAKSFLTASIHASKKMTIWNDE